MEKHYSEEAIEQQVPPDGEALNRIADEVPPELAELASPLFAVEVGSD